MMNTIFLVGYMGAGKSVIGKSLSKSLGCKFFDLDAYIELKEGKKISQIFEEKNEVFFRKLENKYLKELILIKDKKIISTGGGTPCFENNFNIIQSCSNSVSVYLKASVETILDRLKGSVDKRPIISNFQNEDSIKEFIKKHLFERSFYYEKSKIKIITDDIEIRDIVSLIKEVLT
jgi:shikimate kinase